jgi:alanine dehydrogenase
MKIGVPKEIKPQEHRIGLTFSYIPLTLSSWFGVGHSKKNATLTSLAAEFATDIDKLRATTAPRIKLSIFFIIIPLLVI